MINFNWKRNLFLSFSFLFLFSCLSVKAEKIFYDSKSWIVNVAGDTQILLQNGYEQKVNTVNVGFPDLLKDYKLPVNTKGEPVFKKKEFEEYCISLVNTMNRDQFGKKYLDYLTGNGTSEGLLQNLALKNMQIQDVEFGSQTLRGGSNSDNLRQMVAEDYLPLLTHCYICFTKDYKKVFNKDSQQEEITGYFAIYKVKISAEEAFDIMANISNTDVYNKFSFPVEFMGGGQAKDLENIITKKIPGLALRGVLLQRNPAQISLGETTGVKTGDLVSIYSQRQDKEGNYYSKLISRARVSKAWDNESQVNFEWNTAGNRKNGDIVVRSRDSHTRIGVMATWMPHVWGGDIIFDYKIGFAKSGLISHLLMDLGFAITDKPGDKFMSTENVGEVYKAPMFFNIGVGYGIGKTFLGFLDVMPYIMPRYELSMMAKSEGEKSITASSVRLPIGLRLSFNIAYPVKFIVEGGYSFNWGFGHDYDIVKDACGYIGAKREGVFVNAGLIF